MGMDSDHPLAAGEVGRVGVAISSLADMETLFRRHSARPCLHVDDHQFHGRYPACLLRPGRRNGRDADPAKLTGTIQNDILKEYIARGTYIYPPRPAMRIITDLFAWAAAEVPEWNTISISGYHIREAGSTAVQEVAFTFANAIAYIEAALAAGLSIDTFAPRLSFFFNSHNNFLEEVAKFRAARRLYAHAHARSFWRPQPPFPGCSVFTPRPPAPHSRHSSPTSTWCARRIQALAAVLGGAQSLHTNGRDEALSLPTAESARLALRTQQIIAYETGVTHTADPCGGSEVIERLTGQIEAGARSLLDSIQNMGGTLRAIETGWIQNQIQNSAYEYQRQIEAGERVVVGLNRFRSKQEKGIPTFHLDPEMEQSQIRNLHELRSSRDAEATAAALSRLTEAARGEANLMPCIVDAARAWATVGEISGALRSVFGEYTEVAN